MELVTFAKELVQNVAEHAASYRLGQSALRHLDRALWVVEKCARWAVPPPLDQEERPQPELVRPLPWVFFLALLVTLRVARESVSLFNLVLGKPPLRSADVVMYIQSKRRYLRTLKYQGNRMIRARAAPSQEPWYSKLQSMFEFTMCFRRQSRYGNNNTTTLSNNEEVVVVKRSKRVRDTSSPVASSSEVNLERLIEKMMVDLDADSEDDSSFTLTNATSLKSDRSEVSDSDQETLHNEVQNTKNDSQLEAVNVENNVSPVNNDVARSTPEKTDANCKPEAKEKSNEEEVITANENERANADHKGNQTPHETPVKDKSSLSEPNDTDNKEEPKNSSKPETNVSSEDIALQQSEIPKKNSKDELEDLSPIEESKRFLESEKCSPQKSPPTRNTKIVNGRALSANKKKGQAQRRDRATSDVRPSSE